MYTIEKNIPFNDIRKVKSELAQFMDTLELWDSFFIPTNREAIKVRWIFIKSKKFSIKKWENGFRCWRKS